MKKTIFSMAAALLACSAMSPVSAESGKSEEKKVIVMFEEDTSVTDIDEAVEKAGGKVKEGFKELPAASAEMSEDEIDELLEDPTVKHVEEDILISLSAQTEGWGIGQTYAPAAWHSGFSGEGVKIAVVDSGIAVHRDLAIAGGIATVDYTASYADDEGHGTHVAGIIGGLNNDFGVRGIAYDAELYAVKAFDSNGYAYLSDLIESVEWAIANDMDIINLSSGTPIDSDAFHAVLDKAYANGLLTVAAAGNTGNGSGDTVDFPARFSSVIGVGATDATGMRASFSATGPALEIMAPGVKVRSTYPGSTYWESSGTSMAAPFVTGALALLKEAHPDLSNVEIRKLLGTMTIDKGAAGRDPLYGFGALRAATDSQLAVVKMKDVSAVYAPAVHHLVSGEVAKGMNATAFGTWDNIKRVDAAIWLAKELALDTANAPDSGFTDVPDRAFGAVNAIKAAGVVKGKTDTTFGSNDFMTRGEMALILYRAYGLTGSGSTPQFTDVSGHYETAVAALSENHVTNGTTEVTYGTWDNVTRGQLAIFLHRLSQR